MGSTADRAVARIWERYASEQPLAGMPGDLVGVFTEETGVSPGQFLAAVRIYQAKRLLDGGGMSVAAVCAAVGYGSLSSFTSHFTDSVGVSPSRFRRGGHDRVVACGPPPGCPVPDGAAMGTVLLPPGYAAARVYVGVFDTPLVQRRPRSVARLDIVPGSRRAQPYWLPGVPEGSWFLHAVAVADTDEPEPWTRRHQLAGGGGRVRAGDLGAITLHPRTLTDLPVLLALPDLEAELDFLTRVVALTRGR
jgi:AraC family transcriptional regulator